MEKEEIFLFFCKETGVIFPDDTYVVYIQDIFSWGDLLNRYYLEFKFPYFGFNLNALYDSLLDFSWIEKKNIFIVHNQIPDLSGFEDYLGLLGDAIIIWSRYPEEHTLKVFFSDSHREYIDSIVDKIEFYELRHPSPVFPPFK